MAEQEACTALVKQASQDQSSKSSIDGESLLLPLLQGLLDVPENEQTHDSGTESGEDQRSNLIAEVQIALEKLSLNLQNDTNDTITPERRSSLLYLVTKLQVGLATATIDKKKQNNEQFKLNKRHNKDKIKNTSSTGEELIDARKLMDEISESSSRTSINQIQTKSNVKNSTPKPFCSNNVSISSSTSSSAITPSESNDCINYLFEQENVVKPDLFDSEDDSSTIKTLENYSKPDLIMQSNPLYYHSDKDDKTTNRFTSKKNKMKRANTIDIPKPLHFYECADDEDEETDDEEKKRKNNYYALRGPIRMSNLKNRNSMPILEPKTENDKKFLAFINKHNEKNEKHSIWAEKNSIWNNKFDNIKTNFEKNDNTVRNFWKNDNTKSNYGSNKYDPKISKKSAENLKKLFEDREKQIERKVPQPIPVNKFIHAPSSAFKPITRKQEEVKSIEDHQNVFPYSPRSVVQENFNKPSWIGNTNESRVLKIAAKKFENPPEPTLHQYTPKKLNKDKLTPIIINENKEKLTAPFLVKSAVLEPKLSTVRKLSGQYDNLNYNTTTKNVTFDKFPKIQENTKHIEGFQAKFTIPQNYSIKYERPKVDIPRKTVLSKFPFEEHQPTPSDVKKYNHLHHNQHKKTDDIQKYETSSRVTTEIYKKPSINVENLKEYDAINSKVMTGPIVQSASTVKQKSPMTRNEHDFEAAFALKNVLQKVSNTPSPSNLQETYEVPSINIIKSQERPSHNQILSKSDSWHQICLLNQPTHKPSPRSSPISRNIIKSKSTHSMIPPRQYEAGMSKDEVEEKKKTLEGFFGGGGSSPTTTTTTTTGKIKRSINRTKTSEKNTFKEVIGNVSLPTGLSRSRTLPDIVCPDLLDENNYEKAFEDLLSS